MPTFRDFVVLYIAEGTKRDRNRVQICNSDPRMVALAVGWLGRLSRQRLTLAAQHHHDQDLDDLRRFWSEVLHIDAAVVRLQRKSNSGQLTGRTWRSQHGVLTVTVSDTQLRSRLQAWIDFVRRDWALESPSPGGA